jgi:hypothetical protein
MLTPLGAGLIASGLYWLFFTIRRATSEDDLRASERREQEIIERYRSPGIGRFPEWAYRATYHHPVLMRLPASLCVAVGAILILVDVVKH